VHLLCRICNNPLANSKVALAMAMAMMMMMMAMATANDAYDD
jgi:hypothetical protein